MTEYFIDREFGARPRISEIFDDRLWNGLHTAATVRILR
jgi:hypothetical protein